MEILPLYFDNRKSKFNIITLVILPSIFYLFYHSSYSLTPFLTIFQLYCGVQCYWWRKLECPEKTTNLSQVTDKTLSHDVASSTPHLSCNNVAPVTNLCLGRATTRSHSSQWSKKKVAVET